MTSKKNCAFTSSRATIGVHIGARELGYNLTVLPPGKTHCPYHCHRVQEEMFLIIDGEGELRFGADRYKSRRGDVIACPPGGPEVAHQIVNTGNRTLRYLAVSTRSHVEICEYPDSAKILATAGAGNPKLSSMHFLKDAVGYYEGEGEYTGR